MPSTPPHHSSPDTGIENGNVSLSHPGVSVHRETTPLPLISVLPPPSSNPVACRPGLDRRRLSSLRPPPRFGKRDAAYPADHASRHSDRGRRRLDTTTGKQHKGSTTTMQESTANQRSRSEGMRTHGCLPLHFPLPFPVDLAFFSKPNPSSPCLYSGAPAPRGIGPVLGQDGHRPHPRVITVFSMLIPILICVHSPKHMQAPAQ